MSSEGGHDRSSVLAALPAVPADVCLLVEGTYPFVAGGVSSWVHEIIRGHPELRFAVMNVGSHPGAYGEPRYSLPDNVTGLHLAYCREAPGVGPTSGRAQLEREIRAIRRNGVRRPPSRVLSAFRRLHLEDRVDDEVLSDLASADLEIGEFLHGRDSFVLLTELSEHLAPEASFLDLFWHYRAIHVPVLRLLAAPVVPAACYHAVSTGYAGMLAAVWSQRSGRPMALTEHGIYSRERDMELARADWIKDRRARGELEAVSPPKPSALRRLWSHFFRALSRAAYHRAARIVTLSEVNRRRQVADGAPAAKISIVPNGVDVPEEMPPCLDPSREPPAITEACPLRVGFVGRVVPIKDVITFIKACDLALRTVPLEVSIIGPQEEDMAYAQRARDLVKTLQRGASIRFLGPQPPRAIYGRLDVVVLTSFSEGQPLVILEAYAAGMPVVATDVGACREMIEGRTDEDRRIGASGVVTRVASPTETAAALVLLAQDSRLRRRMAVAARKRVQTFYQRRDMLASYRAMYGALVMP